MAFSSAEKFNQSVNHFTFIDQVNEDSLNTGEKLRFFFQNDLKDEKDRGNNLVVLGKTTLKNFHTNISVLFEQFRINLFFLP